MSQAEKLLSKSWVHGIPIALAALLIVSGALKAHQLATEPVAETNLLTSKSFLILIIHCEWVLAAWLLAGICRRAAWWTSIGAFSVFATVALTHVVRGDVSCGCFGSLNVSPWVSLAIDVVAISALLVGREALKVDMVGSRFRVATAAGVLCVLIIPSNWAIASFTPSIVDGAGVIVGADRIVVLEPTEWMGEIFPLARHINGGERLMQGEWEIWLHKSDCEKCVEKLQRFRRNARSARQVVIINVSPLSGEGRDMEACREKEIEYFELSNAFEWFVETPITLSVRQGEVVGVE